ncbi:NADP-dependent oxidoreductase [Acinetobacter sp. P8-3-8]|uniref:NADP-dependent oxidoreductase n=1 Tax=Acinetobacter sp. P8-3-8 TaxID=1029823 RepID=UPI0002487D93|nr:NADP-dependent oxidoreductase [Acinetobacter sp. P8-3-8]
MSYKAFKLSKYPQGNITPDIFDMVTLAKPTLKEGEFLVKQTYMSLDPAMRTWLQQREDSYLPPVRIGEVMRSYGVGIVEESLNSKFPVGSHVVGVTGWSEYVLGNEEMNIIDPSLPPEAVLSLFYMTGLTAYAGLMKIGQPKKGETLVVTGAAGSVGSLVGQLAKAQGLRVVGIAGSDEKCKWLVEELGFDAAINYKSDNLDAQLRAAAPNGVDVFYENTGGPIQEIIFSQLNRFGRVVVCGVLADYDNEVPTKGPSWVDINLKSLRVQGLIVTDYQDIADEAFSVLGAYLAEGKIQYKAHVTEGFESLPEDLIKLFKGENTGKFIVKF